MKREASVESERLRVEYTIFGLFASFLGIFFAGCPEVISTPKTPARAGPNVLAVRISGEAAARTALPTVPDSPTYNINVTRSGTELGGAKGVSGSGPFYIQLSENPTPSDTVVNVAGLVSGKKWAEGSATYNGTPVTVHMNLLTTAGTTGRVDLNISFPQDADTPNEITAVEVSIYRGFLNYQDKAPDSFTRYRKDGYGEGTDFPSPGGIISLQGNYSPGTYVAQIDFFRFNGIRVSRLAQTFVVRGNLTTNTWVETGSNVLTWNAFPSSNADLANSNGILIGTEPIENYNPNKTTYNIYRGVSEIPTAPNLPSITVTQGKPGQTITISLNGASEAPLSSGVPYKPDLLKATNSIVITVTAPDGVTKKTYTVGYIYYYNDGIWYVDKGGNDNAFGTAESPYATLKHLLKIDLSNPDSEGIVQRAYADILSPWPGKAEGNPLAAQIHISGKFTGADAKVDVNGDVHPPILLTGWDDKDGIIDVSNISGDRRPSTIWFGGTLILGDGVTLTGGNHSEGGGGVYALQGSKFIMNGGTISGNTAPKGGGVYVAGDSTRGYSSFTMNGGTISGGTIDGGTITTTGGGVYVDTGCTFTMNGGTIRGSVANDYGGGVYVHSGTNTKFTMTGGTISGNSVSGTAGGGGVYVNGSSFDMSGGTIEENTVSGDGINGGGVYVTNTGSFSMSGGTISKNEAKGVNSNGGGGVYITGSNFTMSGGTISGNKAEGSGSKGGGGVFVKGSGKKFDMTGGSIGGNTASGLSGGGVYVTDGAAFNMSGESSISGNTANGDAGAVRVDGSGVIFTMTTGTISGNKADGVGGAVYVTGDIGSFIMNGGTISGNSGDTGGGVGVRDSGKFTMNAGTISGNKASGSGGGVYYTYTGGTFNMDTSGTITISGNTANGNGGGVYYTGSTFNMNGTITISKNTAYEGGGVYTDGDFNMNTGGTISISGNRSGGAGGGVFVAGGKTFTMNAGTISGNTAAGGFGGGGVGGHATFNMNGGTISENESKGSQGGGGVWLTSGTINMTAGTISKNTADNDGGGVTLVSDWGGTFTMNGGDISENTASDGGGVSLRNNSNFYIHDDAVVKENTAHNNGGGVYFGSTGSFIVDGGTISGNTASNGNGDGVCFNTGNGFNMGGGAFIHQDNDVWLNTGKTINITDDLTGTPPVARITPPSYSPGVPVLSDSVDGSNVSSNHDKFTVTSNGTNWTIGPDGKLQ